CPAFFKKLAVSKGRAFGRCLQRNGGVGACPRPSIVLKKFFGNLFIKKGWAAESRLIKFPVNHNGRTQFAPTEMKSSNSRYVI
ncbi:MAG: hypothetical protein ACI4JM_06890, partial [Oscillospiraceae bacterium]